MPYLKNVHWVDSGRRLRDRFLEHMRSTRLPDRPPHWPPLYIPWSQRRRHVSIGDPFLLKTFNRKAQNWGQNDNLLVGSKGWPSSESARLSPMWPGFKSRHRAICGLSLLLVLSLAPRGFSRGTPPGFPLCGCATSKSLFIYFFRHRTLQSAGLNADFNFIFSKSAGACNVSFCFDFYLNVILRVLFSVALNHWGRGRTLETFGFFVPFQRSFW